VADADYRVPFPFNGTIDRITLTLDWPVLSEADKARLAAALKAGSDN
jgi:hypothetical protein